jgi:hypothetical protein
MLSGTASLLAGLHKPGAMGKRGLWESGRNRNGDYARREAAQPTDECHR